MQILPLARALQVHAGEDGGLVDGGGFAVREDEGAADGLRPGAKDGCGFGVFRRHHGGYAVLEDAGLLHCDLGPGIAEQRAVVQPYGCDDAKLRSDDIGAVQEPSEAGFDNGEVHFLLREPPEGEARGHFEK